MASRGIARNQTLIFHWEILWYQFSFSIPWMSMTRWICWFNNMLMCASSSFSSSPSTSSSSSPNRALDHIVNLEAYCCSSTHSTSSKTNRTDWEKRIHRFFFFPSLSVGVLREKAKYDVELEERPPTPLEYREAHRDSSSWRWGWSRYLHLRTIVNRLIRRSEYNRPCSRQTIADAVPSDGLAAERLSTSSICSTWIAREWNCADDIHPVRPARWENYEETSTKASRTRPRSSDDSIRNENVGVRLSSSSLRSLS